MQEGFLTVFLGEKITITEILESKVNQLSEDDKFNRVDIEALNSKGEMSLKSKMAYEDDRLNIISYAILLDTI